MKKLSFLMCVVVMQAYAADSLPAAMRAAAQPSEHQVEGERKALVCALDEAMQRLDITLQQVRQSVAQRAAQPTSADIKTLMARLARVEDENRALKELLPQYRQEAQDRTSAINLTLARNSMTNPTPEDVRVAIERAEAIGKNYGASLRNMKKDHQAHARVSRESRTLSDESRILAKVASKDAITAKLIAQQLCKTLGMDYDQLEKQAEELLATKDWPRSSVSSNGAAPASGALAKINALMQPKAPAKKNGIKFKKGTKNGSGSEFDSRSEASGSDNGTAREDSLSSEDRAPFEDDDPVDLFSARPSVVAAAAGAVPAGLSGAPGMVAPSIPRRSSLKQPRNDTAPASSAAAAHVAFSAAVNSLPAPVLDGIGEDSDESQESDVDAQEDLSSGDEEERRNATNKLPKFHHQLAPPPSHPLFDRGAVPQAGALSGVVDHGTASSVLSDASKASSVESGDSEPRSVDSGDVDPKPAPLSREPSLTVQLGFSIPTHGEQGK